MCYFLKKGFLILIIFISNIRAMDYNDNYNCKRVRFTESNKFDLLPAEMIKNVVNNILDVNSDISKENLITNLSNLSQVDKRFYNNIKNSLSNLKQIYESTNQCLNKAVFPVKAAVDMGTYFSLQWLKNQISKAPNLLQEVNQKLKSLLKVNTCNLTKQKANKIIFLIKAGADINIQNPGNGNTSLILAACCNNEKMVEFLLDHEADPNIKNSIGNTALAVISNKFYKRIVQLLLKAKADPNIRNNFNDTALNQVSRSGHKDIVKLLIEYGAELDVQDFRKQTALMNAASVGYKNIVELLIESGANPNIKNNQGNTAIDLASDLGFKEIVELLKKYTAEFNKK